MTTADAARILRETYNAAPRGDKTLAVHLFAIRHGEEIRASGLRPAEISEQAGIGKWEASINDGIKLARYVILRE